MEKRGIGHIEIILSFVLFISAVGFGLYFFSAGDSSRLIDTTLDYAFREIEQNASTPVEIFSVSVNGSLYSGTLALNFSGILGETSVEKYNGQILDSKRGGAGGELVYVSDSNFADKEILFVVFGEEFIEDEVATPSEHNSSYYKIGSSEIKEIISEKKFELLKDEYYRDYRDLKSQGNFNLPNRADFGFSLVFGDGTSIVAENEIPDNFEVFSETKRVEVLRKDGSRTFADLVVKVW